MHCPAIAGNGSRVHCVPHCVHCVHCLGNGDCISALTRRTHTRTRTDTHAHTRRRTGAHAQTHGRTHRRTHTHTHAHTRTRTHTHRHYGAYKTSARPCLSTEGFWLHPNRRGPSRRTESCGSLRAPPASLQNSRNRAAFSHLRTHPSREGDTPTVTQPSTTPATAAAAADKTPHRQQRQA